MPRRSLSVAALALLVAPAATSHAQIGYGLAAGPSIPLGDFGKATETGYHLTGLLNVSVPLAPIGFRAEGSFSEFNYTNVSTSAKARILSATANAVFSFPGIIGPYFIGGVGIYHASAVCDGCTTSSTKGGVNGGAGFKIGLAGFSAFVEARYHYIAGASDPTNGGVKSSNTQLFPLSVGFTF